MTTDCMARIEHLHSHRMCPWGAQVQGANRPQARESCKSWRDRKRGDGEVALRGGQGKLSWERELSDGRHRDELVPWMLEGGHRGQGPEHKPMISKVIAHPTCSARRLISLHPCPHLTCLFDSSHPTGYEGIIAVLIRVFHGTAFHVPV